jgi:coenzyme F420-reducing hydrogenase alpha subunit
MSNSNEKTLRVPVLARVEGEGGLDVTLRGGKVTDLKLRIFEPPRLFEKFLEARAYYEVPDAVARICGICPVAYQMSAVQALEQVFDVPHDPWVAAMRRVMYCGEWIESHALHIHLLAAPDFFGCSNVVELAARAPQEVQRGLRLQRLGNDIIGMFGGRSVHPIGMQVGGFARAPSSAEVTALLGKLRAALPEAEALLRWTATWPLPADEQSFTSVALRHPDEYPMNGGRIVSTRGHDLDISQFEQSFAEEQVPHSTALHCRLQGEPYLVGPLARLNLNADRLPPALRELLAQLGLNLPSCNMFHSVIARAAEIYYAVHEALRLLQNYTPSATPHRPVVPRAGVGYGATEAPRGVLWHRYELRQDGTIAAARIVPPTSQNQARMEADLRSTIESQGVGLEEAPLQHLCETVIRNYDPCISCATHFLKVSLRRESA